MISCPRQKKEKDKAVLKELPYSLHLYQNKILSCLIPGEVKGKRAIGYSISFIMTIQSLLGGDGAGGWSEPLCGHFHIVL